MHNIDYDLEYNNAIDKMANGGTLEASFKINTPTGATSKLTYIQQLLVRTKAFKEWFGDWESLANRIVQDRAKEIFPLHTYENAKLIFKTHLDLITIPDSDSHSKAPHVTEPSSGDDLKDLDRLSSNRSSISSRASADSNFS
jgi:hypothetical protein